MPKIDYKSNESERPEREVINQITTKTWAEMLAVDLPDGAKGRKLLDKINYLYEDPINAIAAELTKNTIRYINDRFAAGSTADEAFYCDEELKVKEPESYILLTGQSPQLIVTGTFARLCEYEQLYSARFYLSGEDEVLHYTLYQPKDTFGTTTRKTEAHWQEVLKRATPYEGGRSDGNMQ